MTLIDTNTEDKNTELDDGQNPYGYDELHTVGETCKILKCGPTRLYQFMRSGQLKSVQMGRSRRIPRSAINQFISSLDTE